MPAVASKFIEKVEEMGVGRDMIAKGALSVVVAASVIKLSYPLVKKLVSDAKKDSHRPNNNNSKGIANKNKMANGGQTVLSTESSEYEEYTDEEEKRIAEAEKLLAKQMAEKKLKPPGVNKEFLLQLKALIKIMIPRPFCHETGLLAVHTLCLISRTFLSLIVASMEGRMTKFIVRKDVKNFVWMLLKWFGIAIPATFINSMIRYLENKLALAFRTRLVRHAYKMYFNDQVYYRVSNLDGRIENADHRLTDDISTFASSIAHLYSSLTKPCFDLMLIGLALAQSSKRMNASIVKGPLLGFVVIATTAHIMRVVSPKFGQLVSEEANRYGYLRHIHSRIITNAEEIAFYGGHKVELQQLREAYDRLMRQMNNIFSQKLWFIMLEQFFMKYVWSGTGMVMVSMPILFNSATDDGTKELQVSNRTEWLTTARNLLISQADAIERLMSSYKEIVALAGYTHRVAGMFEVFGDVSKGIYNRATVIEGKNNAIILECDINGKPIANGKIIYTDDPSNMQISLTNVPVVTPNCDIVVPNLTLTIQPGMHLLITGPNGCGKSSLFRILSGLWPIYAGELTLPRPVEGKHMMFYIPQRPYLSIGSLRDQIIYPDTRQDMINKNVSEDALSKILQMVSLEHIALRDNFDEVRDWKDILSGGEKQRMAIARLFYHRPQYALLDECTSAVSIDVESSIYEMAKSMGITLLTITHRPTLWKFHTHILEFDGQGGWTFQQMDSNTQQRHPATKH